jgi:hypothetical protein
VGVLSSTYGSREAETSIEPVVEPGGGNLRRRPGPLARAALRTAVAGAIRTDGATVTATLPLDRS